MGVNYSNCRRLIQGKEEGNVDEGLKGTLIKKILRLNPCDQT